MARWLTSLLFMFSPARAVSCIKHRQRRQAGLHRRELWLDGMRHVYLDSGQGQPLILLHGFLTDKDVFLKLAAYLSPYYRLIIPDLLGFGESDKPQDADYTLAAQAQRLQRFIAQLDLGCVHLAGNSMGGQLALTYAAHHPEQVQSLWLMAATDMGADPSSETVQRLARGERNPLIATCTEDYGLLYMKSVHSKPTLSRGVLKAMARPVIRHRKLHEKIVQQLMQDKNEPLAEGLKTPSLIVWGDKDRMLPAAQVSRLQSVLPFSEQRLMANVGHLSMLEQPQQLAQDFLCFQQRASLAEITPELLRHA